MKIFFRKFDLDNGQKVKGQKKGHEKNSPTTLYKVWKFETWECSGLKVIQVSKGGIRVRIRIRSRNTENNIAALRASYN